MDEKITLSEKEYEKLKKDLALKGQEGDKFIIITKKEYEKLKNDKHVYDAVFEYLAKGLEDFAKKVDSSK